MQSTINFIELLAIVIGLLFGLSGTIAQTKNSSGKLTKWGYISVIGIIITSTFTFINSYLKQVNTKNEQLQNEIKNNEILVVI